MEYECPSCGGGLNFDSASQKLKCPFCDSEYDIDAFESKENELDVNINAGQDWQEGEEDGLRLYACKSCGGEIIGDETLASTKCPYCDNPIVMKGQFAGDLKPDYIIPFKLDKKKAIEGFKSHLLDKKLLPKAFKDENKIEEIKGVYVPFWLFDMNVEASANYKGTKYRYWTAGDYDYTEHKEYDVFRKGNLKFNNVPIDASKSIDNDMMESIEPFKFSEAVEFKTAYLAGYVADKYDVAVENCVEDIEKRVKVTTLSELGKTVSGYDSINIRSSNIKVVDSTTKYALYPVWLLNIKWNDKIYLFAMNGQTGKFIGDLPEDKGLAKKMFWKWFSIFGIGLGALFALISLIV